MKKVGERKEKEGIGLEVTLGEQVVHSPLQRWIQLSNLSRQMLLRVAPSPLQRNSGRAWITLKFPQ